MIETPFIAVAPLVPAASEGDMLPTSLLHLLHLEDNPADAELTQAEIRGVHSAVVFDSASRLAEVTPQRVAAADCAILDLSLPDASGLQSLLTVRAMSDRLPVIVLTGQDDVQLGLEALSVGADAYLVKSLVDGYTVGCAIAFAMERRRMALTMNESLAAGAPSTVPALPAVASRTVPRATGPAGTQPTTAAPAGVPASGPADPLAATHDVLVRVDRDTGDYRLECTSCSWRMVRSPDSGHSWAERSLDRLLLDHVDLGGLVDAGAVRDGVPLMVGVRTEPARDSSPFGPQSRLVSSATSADPAV